MRMITTVRASTQARPPRMSATGGRSCTPPWLAAVGAGQALIAEPDLADGFDSTGMPQRPEMIGYRAATDHAPRLRSQAAGFGAR